MVWLLAAVVTHTLLATWTGTAGSDEESDCVPCTDGSLNDDGVCECEDGFLLSSTGVCVPCKDGSLNAQDVCECPANDYFDQGVCTDCPTGKISPAGSTDEAACVCPKNTGGDGCKCEHLPAAAGSCGAAGCSGLVPWRH